MIDECLLALTRAWLAAVVVSGLTLAGLAAHQVWNGAVYLRGLSHAFELIGEDGSPPVIDRWN
jgi:hypothetical protein